MNRPHLIKADVLQLLRDYERLSQQPSRVTVKVDDHLDTLATLHMLEGAQIVVFSTEQALALLPAIRRFEEHMDFHLPFPSIMFQFSAPIPETDVLVQERDEPDRILAIIVSQTDSGINNAAVWFESSAVNRAQWENESVSPLRIDPRSIETEWDSTILIADNLTPAEVKIRNKEIVRLLAVAMVAYINCENITLERQAVEEKINRKRARQGKRILEDFYTCRIAHDRYETAGAPGTGRAVGFRFDVRGHFRRWTDRVVTGVRSHQRGLVHEMYKPKVYEVGK